MLQLYHKQLPLVAGRGMVTTTSQRGLLQKPIKLPLKTPAPDKNTGTHAKFPLAALPRIFAHLCKRGKKKNKVQVRQDPSETVP